MKILHLISSAGFYGAEAVVVNLAAAQEKLNCEVIVGAFENPRHPELEVLQRAKAVGLRTEVFPCSGRFDRRTPGFLRKYAREQRIDIVHSHGYKPNIYAWIALRNSPVRLVSTCHLWTTDTRAVRFYNWLDSIALKRFDRVICVSEPIAETVRQAGIPGDKVATIDNGINFSPFENAAPADLGQGTALVVGAVGRLTEQKGFEYLLRSAPKLLQKFPSAVIIIVGEGPLREPLQALARELGVADRVMFPGSRTDMPSVYARFDCFVLPSLYEGMPMAIIEAMASGRAIVATNVGGVGKLIQSGVNGLLVEAKDVDALERNVGQVLSDYELRVRLGRQAHDTAAGRFSAETMAKRYLAQYETILRSAQPAAAGQPS